MSIQEAMSQVSAVGCYNRLLVPTGMTGDREVTGDAGAVYPSVNPDVKKTTVFNSKTGTRISGN